MDKIEDSDDDDELFIFVRSSSSFKMVYDFTHEMVKLLNERKHFNVFKKLCRYIINQY